MKLFGLLIFLLTNSGYVLGEMKPVKSGGDPRVKLITYVENEVVTLLSHFGYLITITYAPDEVVFKESIATGDASGWHLVPLGNTLKIKPKLQNNTTNLTIQTNKRVYHYLLRSSSTTNPNDKSITFAVSYSYPGEVNRQAEFYYQQRKKKEAAALAAEMAVLAKRSAAIQGLVLQKAECDINMSAQNFKYTYTGDIEMAPLQTFDDGLFTYFKFSAGSPLPVVFAVDKKRRESLVNFRMSCGYMVIEQMSDQFTLRSGDIVTSIFRETEYKQAIKTNEKEYVQRRREQSESPYAGW